MGEELNNGSPQEIPGSEGRTGQAELLAAVEYAKQKFLSLARARGFPDSAVGLLEHEILPKMTLTTRDEGPAFFRNLHALGEGNEGDSELLMSRSAVESRERKLDRRIPEGRRQELAAVWLIAHELGHALDAAYSLANKFTVEGADGRHWPDYPNAAKEYLDKNPDMKLAKNSWDALAIEKERRCEGFAQEILAEELMTMGISPGEVIAIVHGSYDVQRRWAKELGPLVEITDENTMLRQVYDGRLSALGYRAEPDLIANEIGYANPLAVDEIVRRYNSVTRP